MPRPSNTALRQKQIKDAFLGVLSARGFEGATIVEVARTAKLAPGVVHYHFESKEQILLALVRDLANIASARYQARLPGKKDPRERLFAFIDAQLALDEKADPRAAAAWAAIGAEASRHPRVAKIYRSAIAAAQVELQSLFAQALPRGRAHKAAIAIVIAIEGCFHLAFAAPGVLAKGSAATTVKTLVDGLLK